jgi:hypothetical protein
VAVADCALVIAAARAADLTAQLRAAQNAISGLYVKGEDDG